MTHSKAARRPIAIASTLALILLAAPAWTHHILGVPHDAYDEDYPQTPVLTYAVELHQYEVKMTGYPGNPEPGQRFSLHIYIRNTETGEVLDDTVTLTVTRDGLMGKGPIIYGPMQAHLEEAMYKFFPEFDRAADYTLEIAFNAHGDDWVIELPMTVGEPKSPWAAIGGVSVAIFVVAIVLRAILIKRKREGFENIGRVLDYDHQA